MSPVSSLRRGLREEDDEERDARDGPALTGAVLGGYRLGRYLGRGSTAHGLEAERLADGARAVCKVLRACHRGDTAREAALLHEGELMRELAHPHLMPCLEGLQDQGHTLLVLPWLGGAPLRDVARAAPLPPGEVVPALLGALAGLEHLHAHDVVHRDVKPSNLHRAADGTCRVMDLGLAAFGFGRHGRGAGTAGYRAPEAERGAYDERTDLFSLGLTAHWLLTHGLPGRDERGRPVLDPRLPPMLARWVGQCVALDPDHRYEDAGRATRTLRAAAAAEGIPA